MMKQDDIRNVGQDVRGIDPLRSSPSIRNFLERSIPHPSHIVAALLVVDDKENRENSLPTPVKLSEVIDYITTLVKLGVGAIKLFTKQETDHKQVENALDENSLCLRTIRLIKKHFPDLCIISDTCLCTYAHEGECILYEGDNLLVEESLEILSKHTLLQASAGADIIGPATMSTEVVRQVFEILKKNNLNIPIMPHLTFRTSLHRSYREIMSTGHGKQRQGFQVHPTRPTQYLRMAEDMTAAGAQLLMMQPSLFSFDMIKQVSSRTNTPTGIFSVSGEYKMFAQMPQREELFYEHFIGACRAGADFVVTYAAQPLLEHINSIER